MLFFNENHGENLFNMLERGEIDLLLHNHMRQIPGISAEFFDEGPVAVYHSKESFAKRIWN